jgi:hypothetical protein
MPEKPKANGEMKKAGNLVREFLAFSFRDNKTVGK